MIVYKSQRLLSALREFLPALGTRQEQADALGLERAEQVSRIHGGTEARTDFREALG
jgi:hypothetical protein